MSDARTAGTYPVSLTIVYSLGNLVTVGETVTASDSGSCHHQSSRGPRTSTQVTFSAGNSHAVNRNASIVGYRWSFGDGQVTDGSEVSHAYGSPGAYTVRLWLTDSYGLSATSTRTVILAIRASVPV
jgi:PKD domain